MCKCLGGQTCKREAGVECGPPPLARAPCTSKTCLAPFVARAAFDINKSCLPAPATPKSRAALNPGAYVPALHPKPEAQTWNQAPNSELGVPSFTHTIQISQTQPHRAATVRALCLRFRCPAEAPSPPSRPRGTSVLELWS
jgi:hypothetical protein